MANHISHAALSYPIKNARFTLLVPYLDADGDPTDPTTPDTEVSQDGGAFADAAEEVTTISGSNGVGYLTLSGAETNNSAVALAFKVASGPKATLMTLYPRNLPILASGTASAGAAGSITLASSIDYDITGCFVRTTGGTGGGGSGGANNQVRRITAYNTGTQVATIAPNWETTPDNTTTYDVLLPEGVPAALLSTVNTKLDTIDNLLDTEVAAIKAKTDNLPSDPADASDVAASFSTVNSTLATIASYIDTEVAAIKAKTDLIPASPAAVGDIPTANAIRDAVFAQVLYGSETFLDYTKGSFSYLKGNTAGFTSTGGTVTIQKANNSGEAWEFTLDTFGNRTLVSFTP